MNNGAVEADNHQLNNQTHKVELFLERQTNWFTDISVLIKRYKCKDCDFKSRRVVSTNI